MKRYKTCVAAVLFAFVLAPSLETFAVPTWTAYHPNPSPPVHGGARVAYDPSSNRLIAFLPGNPAVPPNLPAEVWVLRHANALTGDPAWTKLNPTGTPPASNGRESVVYDTGTNRLIVYGGCYASCSPALSQVFVLTNANGLGGTPAWSQLTVTNPQARVYHSAVFDSINNLMIAFGGQLAFFGTDQNDTRVLSNANGTTSPSTWTTLATAGGPPGIRNTHTAVYDAANNRMIIFAGANYISTCCPYNISLYNDVWVLSNANGLGGTPTWTQLSPTGPLPSLRYEHSAVYDPARNKMYVFGGAVWSNAAQDHIALRGDLWELTNANGLGPTAPAWRQLGQYRMPPGINYGHSTAFDPANRLMMLYGGADKNNVTHNWVYVLSF